MTLDQLRTFQTVAAVKSFRHAAELLHITQPAISKQIQALETELDERLFERGRSTRLTLAGVALLKHVKNLSRMLTAAKEEIADLKELRGGHLSIGSAHSIAAYVLPGLIETYRARYPNVSLSIESGWFAEITRNTAIVFFDALGLAAFTIIGVVVAVEADPIPYGCGVRCWLRSPMRGEALFVMQFVPMPTILSLKARCRFNLGPRAFALSYIVRQSPGL